MSIGGPGLRARQAGKNVLNTVFAALLGKAAELCLIYRCQGGISCAHNPSAIKRGTLQPICSLFSLFTLSAHLMRFGVRFLTM